MRFSPDGYYVESYVKCVNCGVLIYNAGLPGQRGAQKVMFCSSWCHKWDAMREAGVENPVLKLE
jgi:hypothetical protein